MEYKELVCGIRSLGFGPQLIQSFNDLFDKYLSSAYYSYVLCCGSV